MVAFESGAMDGGFPESEWYVSRQKTCYAAGTRAGGEVARAADDGWAGEGADDFAEDLNEWAGRGNERTPDKGRLGVVVDVERRAGWQRAGRLHGSAAIRRTACEACCNGRGEIAATLAANGLGACGCC